MNKKMFDMFLEGNGAEDIVERSSKAVCGVLEREVVVRNENVEKTKKTLRSKGFMIIGTSEGNGSTRKIWFIRQGGF